MKANLTLFYSKNVYLNLIENLEIEDLDKITSKYCSQQELRDDPQFCNRITTFYTNYRNYRNKITNQNDKNGHLVLTYYDQNNDFRKLRVLYKKDKVKLDPQKTVNAIVRCLKNINNNDIILSLFREYSFILETEFNYHHYHLISLKKQLSLIGSKNETQSSLSKYNKLVKIVHDELIKGYDKTTKSTTPSSYYHIRLIDEYLERDKGLYTTTKKNNIEIVKENIDVIKSSKLNKVDKSYSKKRIIAENNNKNNYHGMGDYFLDLEDEERRR